MALLEEDKAALKQWLLPKLANRSEAEPEILADYVIELFGGVGTKDEIKRDSVEQLSEFLGDHAEEFVDEVAAGIEKKSWNWQPAAEQAHGEDSSKESAHSTPQPTTATPPTGPKALVGKSTLLPNAPVFVPRGPAADRVPTGPSASHGNNASIPTGPRADRMNRHQQSQAHGKQTQKKRKLQERDTSQARNSGSENMAYDSAGERPHKQLARRGGSNMGANGSRAKPAVMAMPTPAPISGPAFTAAPFAPTFPAGQQMASLPQLPQFPPNVLNPVELMANMSTLMSQFYSGQAFGAQGPKASRGRCVDYETKGICKLGTFCPHDHGKAVVVPADPQYDPNNSALAMQPHINGRYPSGARAGNALGAQRRDRARANFSQFGHSEDENDTVVVEQIPEDHFTEQHVRQFFSEFGAVAEVQMHAYKRLAVVTFNDHVAAQRAYDSPKVIFDNRFVKVYWHKPEHLAQTDKTKAIATEARGHSGVPEIYNEDDEMIDIEEFKKQQAQIQKEFEEKQKRSAEATARSKMLDAQARAKEEAAENLRAKLIEIERAKGIAAIKEKEQRAPAHDLAKLQSEAAGLYAHAGSVTPPTGGRGGLMNGRGSSFRGGHRGRGGVRGGFPRGAGSGVVRLDNRPLRLAIAGVQAGSEKEQKIKRYLLNAKGCNGVQSHVELADTLVVSFEQRFQAEMFRDEATNRIPNVSVGDLSWVPNNATVTQQANESDDAMGSKYDTDEEMSDGFKAEVDLDVAEDTDQWL